MPSLGIKCKAYVNTATGDTAHATPTWAELVNASDFKVSPAWDAEEVMTRATRVKREVLTLLALAIAGKVLVNKGAADYAALQTAFLAGTPVDILILDGANTADGSVGFRADWNVKKFEDDQGPGVVRYKEFELTPAVTANLPTAASVTVTDETATVAYTTLG